LLKTVLKIVDVQMDINAKREFCLLTPVCGNRVCERGENPEICPQDCKVITTTTLPQE
jgi:hypothetical protein